MASPEYSGSAPGYTGSHDRRANPMGAYVAAVGVVIFLVSVFLDWFSLADSGSGDNSVAGYNLDSVIPFTAYLGVGLVLALLYAIVRARGRQHRGLTLVAMAVGIAAVLLSLSNLFDATGVQEGDDTLDVEIGVWIALVGSIIWSIGAGLLAKEPEGDDDWRGTAVTDGRP
jgi:ABC-type Fe3+-siderophore transport system permease subunit